jgi:hypothetical protein
MGLDFVVLTGASTRGMPKRAARCLRFSSSGSTTVGVEVITGGETAGAGVVVAGAGLGLDVVGFGAGGDWSAFQSIL